MAEQRSRTTALFRDFGAVTLGLRVGLVVLVLLGLGFAVVFGKPWYCFEERVVQHDSCSGAFARAPLESGADESDRRPEIPEYELILTPSAAMVGFDERTYQKQLAK